MTRKRCFGESFLGAKELFVLLGCLQLGALPCLGLLVSVVEEEVGEGEGSDAYLERYG